MKLRLKNLRKHDLITLLIMYMLIQLLHGESRLTTLQIRMVSEHKLCRLQRQTYQQLQAKIFSLWDQYENSDQAAKQLLRACSELYGLRDCYSNPIVEQPCSLLVRSNTKTAPVGATQSIKVVTHESSLYFTVWPHYFLFPVAPAPTHI